MVYEDRKMDNLYPLSGSHIYTIAMAGEIPGISMFDGIVLSCLLI